MTTTKYCLIYCTCPEENNTAMAIADYLVQNKLAACVNILPKITSIYKWQNKTETSVEQLLIIKTKVSNYSNLEKAILDLHPYDCPEIIATNIEQGFQQYLSWINNNS